MSVNVIATKSYVFRNPEDGMTIKVTPGAFATLPDWVKKDPLYGWAIADKTLNVSDSVTISANTTPIKAAETVVTPEPEKTAPETDSDVKTTIANSGKASK